MKLMRVVDRGNIINLALIKGEVYRLKEDAVNALIRYSRTGAVNGERTQLDVEGLLKKFEVGGVKITKPLDPPEVWGSGISYEISRARYSEEDVAKIMGKTIYERVYEAERPEIFFKATANRCVGHGEPIVVRRDSQWTLPEPELGVVLDSKGKVLGYTVVDDVSARDIESENPLYLPQSKIYAGCCAIGPVVVTVDEIPNPYSLGISLRILRSGKVLYEGSTSTSRLRRRIEEQVDYLIRDNPIPDGTVLTTGTGIVPGREYGLKHGDMVEISIEGIGTLITPVVKSGYL
jgi:2-dehydro-3-deoxy-D-arabinonate dehydratase